MSRATTPGRHRAQGPTTSRRAPRRLSPRLPRRRPPGRRIAEPPAPSRRGTPESNPALAVTTAALAAGFTIACVMVGISLGHGSAVTLADAPVPHAAPTSHPPIAEPPAARPTVRATEKPVSVAEPVIVANSERPRPIQVLAAETVHVDEIPQPALAAYQHAEVVMAEVRPDPDRAVCAPSWTLLAAIGQVASDHGQTEGSTLSLQGLATPAIFGSEKTVVDTDAASLDADARHDRAVGPMQFLPSTWMVVGVDADQDGKRRPQDIDDAALATAVLLCAEHDDLSTPAGQRAAVARYNPNPAYVSQVIATAAAYETDLIERTSEQPVTVNLTPPPPPTPVAEPSADPSPTTAPHPAPPVPAPNPGPTSPPSDAPGKG